MITIKKLMISITLLLTIPAYGTDYLMLTEAGTSAKMIALGQIEGFDNSSNSLFENPASLGSIKNTSISAYSTTLINEFEITNFSISQKTKWGTFAIGQFSGKISDIPRTSTTGSGGDQQFLELGEFEYTDTLTKIGYQNNFKSRLSYGFTLNRYTKNIDNVTADGYDIDAGIKTKWGKTSVSLIAKNILERDIQYSNNQVETLPRQIILGGLYDLGCIGLYGQAKLNGEKGIQKSAGVSAHIPSFPYLKLLAGYKEYFVLDDLKKGTAIGIALDMGPFSLSYAYEKSDYVEFDSKSYFSMSLNLNLVDEFKPKSKRRLHR
jgi:competence protein ComGC